MTQRKTGRKKEEQIKEWMKVKRMKEEANKRKETRNKLERKER